MGKEYWKVKLGLGLLDDGSSYVGEFECYKAWDRDIVYGAIKVEPHNEFSYAVTTCINHEPNEDELAMLEEIMKETLIDYLVDEYRKHLTHAKLKLGTLCGESSSLEVMGVWFDEICKRG